MIQKDLSEYMTILENSSPFEGLQTEYLQHKYYKEHFNYLVNFLGIHIIITIIVSTTVSSFLNDSPFNN